MLDRRKLYKLVGGPVLIICLVAGVTRIANKNSITLSEHEASLQENLSSSPQADAADQSGSSLQDDAADQSGSSLQDDAADQSQANDISTSNPREDNNMTDNLQNNSTQTTNRQPDAPLEDSSTNSALIGATLNGNSQKDLRFTYTDGFYQEPISDNLKRYITGVSYPFSMDNTSDSALEVDISDLSYLHVWHYNFDGNPAEGELICNNAIAKDLLEIFYALYRSEYRIESIRLIDEYNGDDDSSMKANNSSCFNYRVVAGTTNLSKHAYGLAVDINPFYNPYITYPGGEPHISPEGAEEYADRSRDFSYKIDTEDYCYQLFTEHGFTWGGNWNHTKDYQHFQKSLDVLTHQQ